MTSEVASEAENSSDYDGLFKSMMEMDPAETLHLFCRTDHSGGTEILDGPTEHQRQRSRHKDKVFVVPAQRGSRRAKVYLIEVQLKRTADFQERLVSYWASAALKYPRKTHEIHQVVIWPWGNGFDENFERDGVTLRHRRVNVPDDLDPEETLNGAFAPLALFARKLPANVVDRVADRVAEVAGREEKLILAELAMLAEETLAGQFAEALWRRGMRNILEGTRIGDEIAERNLERGIEQGIERGIKQGREQGSEAVRLGTMTMLLRHQYGEIDDLDEVAARLATTNYDENCQRVLNKAPIEELRSVGD